MGIPDHLTCFLRNLYTGQEATVRTGHGTTDWFHIRKGVRQGCILSPCLFNFHAEYIMRNIGLEVTQAGIKIARKNINNLRYADNTTLMVDFPGGLDGKASVYNAGDLGSIPGSGRPLEKELAIHSSTIAWKIPWTEEPDRLQSMESQRVIHN